MFLKPSKDILILAQDVLEAKAAEYLYNPYRCPRKTNTITSLIYEVVRIITDNQTLEVDIQDIECYNLIQFVKQVNTITTMLPYQVEANPDNLYSVKLTLENYRTADLMIEYTPDGNFLVYQSDILMEKALTPLETMQYLYSLCEGIK